MDKQGGRRRRTVIVALAGTVLALVVLVPVANRLLTADVEFIGLGEGASINSDALRGVRVAPAAGTELSEVEVLVNGAKAAVRPDGDHLQLDQPSLPDGEHEITARVASAVPLMPGREVTRRFTVDNSAPVIAVDAAQVQDLRKPLSLSGRVEGATWVSVNDQEVPLAEDGSFKLELKPVPASVRISAKDATGNSTGKEMVVQARHPGMRGVHMTALAWASPQLRDPVLQLAKEGRIDTVQLDIKDESGEIGYDSQVPLGRSFRKKN